MLKRLGRREPVHHGVELGRRAPRGQQQPGLVLGEDAADRPEPADEVGLSWRYGRTLEARTLEAGSAARIASRRRAGSKPPHLACRSAPWRGIPCRRLSPRPRSEFFLN